MRQKITAKKFFLALLPTEVLMRVFVFVVFFFTWQAMAEIRELSHLEQVLSEVCANTLVVFDLDNTVIRPAGFLGSDEHYYYLTKSTNSYHANMLWNRLQYLIKTRPVEELTSSIITQMQNITHVMALTARYAEIQDITRHQLAQNNIFFTRNAPSNQEIHLMLNEQAVYNQGILYQGESNNKGEILVKFLEKINHNYNKIIFIDDKAKNTQHVHEALNNLIIEHIEFRYNKTDILVNEYNKIFNSISQHTKEN
jgi:hypothetical protein